MTNKQANILFIPTSTRGNSSGPQNAPSHDGYYQRLIFASLARSTYTTEGFLELGQRLADIARHAYLAKEMNAVEQACELMLALPVSSQLESIARYYQALRRWRQGDNSVAFQFERTVEEAPPSYKARALQAIGLSYQKRGDSDEALRFYVAAGKAGETHDLLTLADSQQMIAVVRSLHGDHSQALAHLEASFPLIRAISKHYPQAYYTFLNHLAVELSEVGRLAEAEGALSISLASPFAAAYPEWIETREEIAAKRVSATPSTVAVNQAAEVTLLPLAQPNTSRKVTATIRRVSRTIGRTRTLVQPALGPIPASAASANLGAAQSILDRVRDSITPRGPPA